jgi:hypothetical protein
MIWRKCSNLAGTFTSFDRQSRLCNYFCIMLSLLISGSRRDELEAMGRLSGKREKIPMNWPILTDTSLNESIRLIHIPDAYNHNSFILTEITL